MSGRPLVDGILAYDIISGGSGFHQTLTLLAFLFGYKPTTILLDEPDAHLQVSLQREIRHEIHEDVHAFVAKVRAMTGQLQSGPAP